ncbi:Uncharacterised protein [Yersinia frederiksenii]|nr:Uncharacterised protein [Yersinia frederiksenii]
MITRDQTDQSCCSNPGVVGGRRLADLGGPVKGCPARHGKSHSDIRYQIAISILHGSAHGIGGNIVRHCPTGDSKVSATNDGGSFIRDEGGGFRGSSVSSHRGRDVMIARDPTDQ